uniref:Uncharacterized protein n=1 Tax=Allium cepa TaxID=4679 RepID=Q2XNX3_ALLCE|nr:hypothetical protein 11.t00008 [Allium cepa]
MGDYTLYRGASAQQVDLRLNVRNGGLYPVRRSFASPGGASAQSPQWGTIPCHEELRITRRSFGSKSAMGDYTLSGGASAHQEELRLKVRNGGLYPRGYRGGASQSPRRRVEHPHFTCKNRSTQAHLATTKSIDSLNSSSTTTPCPPIVGRTMIHL